MWKYWNITAEANKKSSAKRMKKEKTSYDDVFFLYTVILADSV